MKNDIKTEKIQKIKEYQINKRNLTYILLQKETVVKQLEKKITISKNNKQTENDSNDLGDNITVLRKEKRDRIELTLKAFADEKLDNNNSLDFEQLQTILSRNVELEKEQLLFNSISKMRSQIIEENIKLCRKIATDFKNPDLYTEGVFGLMVALDRFEIDRGLQFSTFATQWIRHYIQRYIQNNFNVIRVPVNIQDKKSSLKKGKKLNTKALERIMDSNFYIESFNQVYDRDIQKTNSLEEFLSQDEMNTEDLLIAKERNNQIHILSSKVEDFIFTELKIELTDIQKKILKEKIFNLEPKSLSNISYETNKTIETIRKAENKLLSILNKPSVRELVVAGF